MEFVLFLQRRFPLWCIGHFGWLDSNCSRSNIHFVCLVLLLLLFFTFNLHIHGLEVRPEIWILCVRRIWGCFSGAMQRFEISDSLTSVSSPFPFKRIQWLSYSRYWIVGFVLFYCLPFFSFQFSTSHLILFQFLFFCWDFLFSFISVIFIYLIDKENIIELFWYLKLIFIGV